jgi:hypothetical protein
VGSDTSRRGGFAAGAAKDLDHLNQGGLAVAKGFVHTVYKHETWLNELEEGEELAGTYATKEEAAAAGRERAIRDKTEHVIHKQHGEFGERNSYGNDPRGGG